eukprot:scaffold74618_cov67-Phaeocystis_antarctica.AAC.3
MLVKQSELPDGIRAGDKQAPISTGSDANSAQLAANEAALSCRKPASADSTLRIVSPARHASQRRRFSLRSAALFPWLPR